MLICVMLLFLKKARVMWAWSCSASKTTEWKNKRRNSHKVKHNNKIEKQKNKQSETRNFHNSCTSCVVSMATAIPHEYGRVYVGNLPKSWHDKDVRLWVNGKHLPEPSHIGMFHKARADCASAYITWKKATTGRCKLSARSLQTG